MSLQQQTQPQPQQPQQQPPTQNGNKVISWQDSNGELWLKGFLINGKVNKNDWGVKPFTIPNILKKTAIGQPITLYKDRGDEQDRFKHKRVAGSYNHPVLAMPEFGDTIHTAIARQEAAAVGRIVSIQQKEETGDWYWIGRITDPQARQAFASDPKMPFFTSPSIWINSIQPSNILYGADGTPEDVDSSNPFAQVEDWQFMHIALVDTPAYGRQAMITAKCTGDSSTCMNHLKYASESKPIITEGDDHGACGCTKQGMNELAANVRKAGLEKVADHSDTSRKSSDTQQDPVIMSVNENSEKENEKTTTEKKQVVEEKKETNNTQQPQPNQNSPAEKKEQVESGNQQLTASLIEKLSSENQQLKTLLETQTPLIKTLQQKVATMDEELSKGKEERRLWELRSVVQDSKIHRLLPIEEQEKLVQKYAAAQMTGDSLKEFIAPFETINPTQYVQNNTATAVPQKVASSSNNNQVPSRLDYPAAQKVASSEGSAVTHRQPKFKLITTQLKEVGI